ncbi:MAG: outer membrane beta-barrel protein [Devosia sp.]|nr:outer membrane beta-barrel protein [Devosia sp.]
MKAILAIAPVAMALAAAGAVRADDPSWLSYFGVPGASNTALTSTPDFAFSGPYIGVHFCGNVPCVVGTDSDNLTPVPAGRSADSFGLSGLTGGVYGGVDWQQGRYVLGLDGSVDWTSLRGAQDFSVFSGLVTGTMALKSDWQGSLKARAGVLVTDWLLLYGTAGVTAAYATVDVSGVDNSGPGPFSASQSHVHIGGTVGLGAEFALTDHLVARTEVDYTSFAPQTYDFGLGQFSPTSVHWDQLTGTVGLAVRF